MNQESKKINADQYLFKNEEEPITFRSMIVPDKVLKNDSISKN